MIQAVETHRDEIAMDIERPGKLALMSAAAPLRFAFSALNAKPHDTLSGRCQAISFPTLTVVLADNALW
jgi:hypothetical protein